jgi:hypothetical protein
MAEPNRAREEAWSAWQDTLLLGESRAIARAAFEGGWEALAERLGAGHYVIFTEDRWTVEHSVECRLSGQMHTCAWHKAVQRITGEFDSAMEGRWLIKEIDSEGLPLLERAEASDG